MLTKSVRDVLSLLRAALIAARQFCSPHVALEVFLKLLWLHAISGVTTDPADPAMRGGPRPMGGPKIMPLSFSLKIPQSNYHGDVRYDE